MRARFTAPTQRIFEVSSGCEHSGRPWLPADATMTMPARAARSIAWTKRSLGSSWVTMLPIGLTEMLMTSAPRATAASMPAASWSVLPLLCSSSTRIASTVAPGAVPSIADPVAGMRGDDPGDVRPVTVLVGGDRVAVDEVGAFDDVAGEIGMRDVDAAVEDRDDRARPDADLVRLVGLDRVEVPLVAAQRIGRERSARQQEQ